jgi:hypothetical protein
MELGGFLPCSQQLATCAYFEPNLSSSRPSTQFLNYYY